MAQRNSPADLANHTASLSISSDASDGYTVQEALIRDAEAFVKRAFENHDPSHDWHHVNRVRQLALSLRNSPDVADEQLDLLVVELAALFHDLNDAKYAKTTVYSSGSLPIISSFFDSHPSSYILDAVQRERIVKIVDNVSWSKDCRRREARQRSHSLGEEPSQQEKELDQWLDSCREFWCVSDADRLDAIGSIGIMRCAAFSAVKMRPLYVPPNNAQMDSRPPAEQGEGYNGSAVAHFHEKLVKIRGDRLYTQAAKVEAERRQQMMESFLTELDLEWMVAAQGAEMAKMV
ncbi:uncharacterized protein PFL1_05020 [Pseudozyma flocculosa PF-1]|uniref:HD/PDEase domain-containing protein n=2 Tax=Pseudozyma flocculosa TaxID=84751 RepID=A0A5C3EXH9_9BASI|nr:uncharacterized protein PFL1_05020 [Pseudozyma flocculosa PF-1]EPQ27482.1 hypothetical protein PFL1_05020 [Pseudozyma flocculosa PF-1]SPO36087.1 uncharacterized protein PSFLO_01558 [Pseudozyma flocculosa]